MDDPIQHQESGPPPPDGLFVRLQLLSNLLHWLARLIHLTADEQTAAGIYLDGQHDR